ncbi:hypothetical protein HDV05_006933 [Chytridiales sp. JEL 0842]|nr:hypothetical protein HDV05_006933 [Chytridiales sp. JEL 0842]
MFIPPPLPPPLPMWHPPAPFPEPPQVIVVDLYDYTAFQTFYPQPTSPVTSHIEAPEAFIPLNPTPEPTMQRAAASVELEKERRDGSFRGWVKGLRKKWKERMVRMKVRLRGLDSAGDLKKGEEGGRFAIAEETDNNGHGGLETIRELRTPTPVQEMTTLNIVKHISQKDAEKNPEEEEELERKESKRSEALPWSNVDSEKLDKEDQDSREDENLQPITNGGTNPSRRVSEKSERNSWFKSIDSRNSSTRSSKFSMLSNYWPFKKRNRNNVRLSASSWIPSHSSVPFTPELVRTLSQNSHYQHHDLSTSIPALGTSQGSESPTPQSSWFSKFHSHNAPSKIIIPSSTPTHAQHRESHTGLSPTLPNVSPTLSMLSSRRSSISSLSLDLGNSSRQRSPSPPPMDSPDPYSTPPPTTETTIPGGGLSYQHFSQSQAEIKRHQQQQLQQQQSKKKKNNTPSTNSLKSFASTFGTEDSNDGYRYRVLTAHVPGSSDELVLNVKDLVCVYLIFEDAWAFGMNVTTDRYGIFPLKCIRKARNEFQRKVSDSASGYSFNSQMATMLRPQSRSDSKSFTPTPQFLSSLGIQLVPPSPTSVKSPKGAEVGSLYSRVSDGGRGGIMVEGGVRVLDEEEE